ncbi:hypothetical protein KOR42_11920 [Thalassoglobus neptunius]|uniref:Methane oxygenase PmoA n=1 Tax=Thalassoglobus neptunius TaxID=1938619 RepID=A0A5C5X6Q4_9PLAN|nr:PmoA family protein [Thalassoglobus neptunius]TWT57825.1 hypothetical protein KOR42_11920 [Thalassoglobus neptunius]
MSGLPYCEIIPLPNDQVSFRINGVEKTRWYFGSQYLRPFFFPINSSSGQSLTRMGHPGAPNHDHHQSVWFAHHRVLGIDFWANGLPQVRQKEWFVYDDGEGVARMAVRLEWADGHDPSPLLHQELIVQIRSLPDSSYTLDLQSTFLPESEMIEFQKTNFGFLAVRVAKSISVHFGDGVLTGASGATGEPNLFGQENIWMDYSGSLANYDEAGNQTKAISGITYFDHPENPSHPTKWHVREDGWMGASACFSGPLETTRDRPLKLRYLLHVHDGPVDPAAANALFSEWQKLPWLEVVRSKRPHQHYELQSVNE